jgi:DnaJ-class molecular chaperone
MNERHDEEMAPGDEVPPGAAPSGENVCPDCGGSGEREGASCETCAGSGTIREGIGGG